MRGTWQTTGGSGAGGSLLIAVVVVAVFGAAFAGPVVHAAEDLVRIVLITAAVLAVLAGTGIGLAVRYRRRTPPPWTVQVQQPPDASQRVLEVPAAAQRIPAPQIHLHLHGPVSAADVAELIARQGNPQPAIEEDSQ